MSIKSISRAASVCLIWMWIAGPAASDAAAWDTAVRKSEEIQIARCIRTAAGGRHWLEKTLWGLRDQEGGWLGAEVENSNGSHDLGPLQINSWWIGRIARVTRRSHEQVRWWLANDACFNVQAARWIFLTGLAATNDYWAAVGAYHSPTKWRQQRYAENVLNRLRKRFGRHVFKSGTPKPVTR